MYGYKVIIEKAIVSCNRGYDTAEQAKEHAKSDAMYFKKKSFPNSDVNIEIDIFND